MGSGRMEHPICSLAEDGLSLESQARLSGADNYLHGGMCAERPLQPGDLPAVTEHLFTEASVEG